MIIALSQLASAQMMDYYGSMMGGWGMGFVGLLYLALASFVFSVVFWLTYNWLAKKR